MKGQWISRDLLGIIAGSKEKVTVLIMPLALHAKQSRGEESVTLRVEKLLAQSIVSSRLIGMSAIGMKISCCGLSICTKLENQSKTVRLSIIESTIDC